MADILLGKYRNKHLKVCWPVQGQRAGWRGGAQEAGPQLLAVQATGAARVVRRFRFRSSPAGHSAAGQGAPAPAAQEGCAGVHTCVLLCLPCCWRGGSRRHSRYRCCGLSSMPSPVPWRASFVRRAAQGGQPSLREQARGPRPQRQAQPTAQEEAAAGRGGSPAGASAGGSHEDAGGSGGAAREEGGVVYECCGMGLELQSPPAAL